jgi:hypothetical protein
MLEQSGYALSGSAVLRGPTFLIDGPTHAGASGGRVPRPRRGTNMADLFSISSLVSLELFIFVCVALVWTRLRPVIARARR